MRRRMAADSTHTRKWAIDRRSLGLYNPRLVAAVAQLVEQRIRNAKVASSIPASGTSRIKQLASVTSRGFLLSGVCVGMV